MYLELQKWLFETKPGRRELLTYKAKEKPKYHVQVFRNHSFELVEHTIGAYLDYAQIGVSFSYSGYDDSLSFAELDQTADLILLWIDAGRYGGKDIQGFLAERVAYLGNLFPKPILLALVGQTVEIRQANTVVIDLSEISAKLGDGFTDERAKAVTGTSLSSRAMLEISRELGLRYLPGLLRPALKAILVDLDNTLYAGVLGEDGADGIRLTPGHGRLQQQLKRFSEQGFFLCAVSKNDPTDVEELFRVRTDFPLKKEDFTQISASWDAKADSIRKTADFLHIDPESMVFVDDNIGELMSVCAAIPSIHLLHAQKNADITCEVLTCYPGLFRLSRLNEDAVRKNDIQSQEERQALKTELSYEEYLRSLNMQLKFEYCNTRQTTRIAELANKTNQFIFRYQRYSEREVENRMRSPEYLVVSVSLSDRLSDSGLIGVCVGRKLEDYVEIEECFVSCRALGRGIEDILVLGAIQGILTQFHVDKLLVPFVKGPRNTPAEQFVKSHLEPYQAHPAKFFYQVPDDLLEIETVL